MDILHANEMNILDEYAISHIGIPQCVLMERAALGVWECIAGKTGKTNPAVLVLSGPGNCGGDGLALSRILLDKGIDTEVYLPVSREKCKESIRAEAEYFEAFGGKIQEVLPDKNYDIIVDALFGVGLNRPVKDSFEEAVRFINEKREKTGACVFSVDIPSGIHTDTGAVLGTAVRADYTVTFSYLKPGLLLYPGREYAGKIIVKSIGIDSLRIPDSKRITFTYGADFVTASCHREKVVLKKRRNDGNKGTFHRILVIAGSRNMAGAAILCSESALRSGAGLVELYTHEINREAVLSAVPEVILNTYGDKTDADISADKALKDDYSDNGLRNDSPENELAEMTDRSGCVIIGPGLSKSDVAKTLVAGVLKDCKKPVVIDADGINLISSNAEYRELLKKRHEKGLITVLTPHPAELERLTGIPVKELLADYENNVKKTAAEYHVILVGKGATTVVSDGERTYFNLSGNNGMATAGSGDVLSGMTGAFLLNEENAFEGVCRAVYAHGLAGDAISDETGHRGMLAGDIIRGIKRLENE